MRKLTQSEQINQAIENLHNRSSGDYQSLIRQVRNNQKKVALNFPQMVASISIAKTLILEWSRRTGKTAFRGYRWGKIVETMPRSSGAFVVPSYVYGLTKIIPSIIRGLELFGLYKDLHYFIGKKPPRSWRSGWGRAYMAPEDYSHYITFFNGVGIYLVSQEVKGDGRAITTDFIDADECGELNGDLLVENVEPTMSGTHKNFKGATLFGSVLYTGSTPLTPDGLWFIEYEEKAMQAPQTINFIRANCIDNAENLRDGYLEEAKAKAVSMWRFNAEYLNIRPKFTKGGFYGLLDKDIHGYVNYDYNHYRTIGQKKTCLGDLDLRKDLPLIVGMDWGGVINCLTINQYIIELNEYRTIKSFYVLGEDKKIQDDLFAEVVDYYSSHTKKEIFFYYDNSGNNQDGRSRQTKAQAAQQYFIRHGWKCILRTVGGRNEDHEVKQMVWERILREDDKRLPKYRINIENAKEAYISMRNAKLKHSSKGRLQKDKSSEKSKTIRRQHATDLSDANDTPVVSMFTHIVEGVGVSSLPSIRVT